jgi:hypothetical protein
MKHIHEKIEAGKANYFRKDYQGILWFNDRIVVPKDAEVRQQILDEAHCWNLLSAASRPTRVNSGDNRVTCSGAIALLI